MRGSVAPEVEGDSQDSAGSALDAKPGEEEGEHLSTTPPSILVDADAGTAVVDVGAASVPEGDATRSGFYVQALGPADWSVSGELDHLFEASLNEDLSLHPGPWNQAEMPYSFRDILGPVIPKSKARPRGGGGPINNAGVRGGAAPMMALIIGQAHERLVVPVQNGDAFADDELHDFIDAIADNDGNGPFRLIAAIPENDGNEPIHEPGERVAGAGRRRRRRRRRTLRHRLHKGA